MIKALIVIYNKNIEESITYQSLKGYSSDIKTIIFDNSNQEYIAKNKEYSKNNDIVYYTLNKNVGLSKAYNYVAKRIAKNDGYIVILDDDTPLRKEYLDEMFNLTLKGQYDIILPIIYSCDKIISPANVQFNCRIKMLKNIEELNINKISAINSGMIIRNKIFNEISYNEEMFVDYVDHDFMKKVRKNNYRVYVMDSYLNQNYSRFQKNHLKSEINRFKIHYKDFKIYCKDCNNMLFFYASTLKYRIHECIKYKTVKFLFIK